MAIAKAAPGETLLDPSNHTLIMIDHQSQMSFATKSIDAVSLRNNAALVSKAAKEFKVSTILTTVAEKSFSGPIFDEIRSVFPDHQVIDRSLGGLLLREGRPCQFLVRRVGQNERSHKGG